MPTFSVRLIVNVPGVGDRPIDQNNITAPDMAAAVKEAMSNIKMRPVQVVETAP